MLFGELPAGSLIFHGVAVDADEAFLFHQTIDQGIVKRTLDSGKLLWNVQNPGVPLAVIGQNLWLIEGSSDQFRILALNTETGTTVHTSTWFNMLGLPAIFDYNVYQGLSVNVEAGWAAATQTLWILVNASTQYAGGAVPGPDIEAASYNAVSMLVKVIPATANISLTKTNQINGFTKFIEKKQDNELPIAFPSECIPTQVKVNSRFISSQKHWVLRSAQLSNYVVLLQILPVDNFSSSLLLLRVFSSDPQYLVWQQCIGNYYVEPARC